MRIVAGAWRGRRLVAPPGAGTRPTADRVRQALFDVLLHARWAGRSAGEACGLVFLDPPYGQDLVARAVPALAKAGWLAEGALLVAEVGREEALELPAELLDERSHGAARLTFWRMASYIGGK